MVVYRIANQRFADLSGTGGLFAAGRWNNKGKPVVYTSATRSLSMLERYIHETSANAPPDLVMLSIHIPDDTPIDSVDTNRLPKDWQTNADNQQTETRVLGDNWLSEQRHGVLKVPSAIVPQECNYLINPLMANDYQINVINTTPYQYDGRFAALIAHKNETV